MAQDSEELCKPGTGVRPTSRKTCPKSCRYPIKNTVLFPGVVIPITVTRQKSIRLIKKAYQGNRIVGVIAQKQATEEPSIEDIYRYGTVAHHH